MTITPIQLPTPDSRELRLRHIYIGGEDVDSAVMKVAYDEVLISGGEIISRRDAPEGIHTTGVAEHLDDTITIGGNQVTLQTVLRAFRMHADQIRDALLAE